MIGLFELYREAGVRLPKAVGQAIAVVGGGLIVGDAAIRAGFQAIWTRTGVVSIFYCEASFHSVLGCVVTTATGTNKQKATLFITYQPKNDRKPQQNSYFILSPLFITEN
ncbi:spore germination protein [Gracilibacillus caseinilyticus]|uniref:spore germination protein n=1 Tax=Gracilibacillus caseinilyticus TaxID=2932256 RepID=UPI00350FA6A2